MNQRITNVTANWSRCIYVQETINEAFIRKVTPLILEMRQENSQPITVAIDSPGGVIGLLPTLFGLLRGPDQDGRRCQIITVSVNHSYSAAASLLAMGDYAVAMKHSDILFHDVRYGGMDDVTPAKAANAASTLKMSNNRHALKLANHVFDRMIWNYIDIKPKFGSITSSNQTVYDRYKKNFETCLNGSVGEVDVDLAGFWTAIYTFLSRTNEKIVDTAIENLCRWRAMTLVAEHAQKGGSGANEFLEPSRNLFDALKSMLSPDDVAERDFSLYSTEVGLIHTLLVEHLLRRSPSGRVAFSKLIDVVKEDFELIQSINDPSHYKRAEEQMLEHRKIFFKKAALDILENGDEVEREKVLAALRPSFQLFWHFCVLLCRELFNGEHVLTASEAQIIGIIDEVAGGGPIESLREFRVAKHNESQVASGQ